MRISLRLTGIVQGIGFRPFVQRQATALGLSGWIRNGRSGVDIEVCGPDERITDFCHAVEFDLPRPGRIATIERKFLPDDGVCLGAFHILPSNEAEPARALLPPDLAICAECLADVRSSKNRRRDYALTCCAHCGPRYSIVEELPYDRARTTMRGFAMCEDCRLEYDDPENRRFHAEPIACPRCGPEVVLLARDGTTMSTGKTALDHAALRIRRGEIVALRGLGGYQLLCLATDEIAVEKLRQRKERPDKPFAILFANIEMLARHGRVSPAERHALTQSSAPIVLLRRIESSTLAPNVAPGCPLVGAMLPTTAMHQISIDSVGAPLVCTSGNRSGEPLCVDTNVALKHLGSIADVFLSHNRPIKRPIDDSVVREGPRGISVLRRARGFAPLPVFQLDDARCILGVGAHLKNSISLLVRGDVIMSQHIGDMDDIDSVNLHEMTVRDMLRFFDVRPDVIACDLHPDFPSTRLSERLAHEWNVPLLRIQHHHAHVAAVLAEHQIEDDVSALVWDGYGFGLDTRAWGGEVFAVRSGAFHRVGHLQPFRLPGGDKAASEPWRSALGVLFSTLGQNGFQVAIDHFDEFPVKPLWQAMERGFAAPWTTSMGRLFDAISAFLRIRNVNSFEGQAAMELEWCAETNLGELPEPYVIPISNESPGIAQLEPLVRGLVAEIQEGKSIAELAARFISSVAELGLRYARYVGLSKVILAGGCFQNDLLTRTLVRKLESAGFQVFLPRVVPVNDGGISAGQVALASWMKLSGGQ